MKVAYAQKAWLLLLANQDLKIRETQLGAAERNVAISMAGMDLQTQNTLINGSAQNLSQQIACKRIVGAVESLSGKC